MITPENAVKAIKQKIEQLSNVGNYQQFNIWQKSTSSTLVNIYPNVESTILNFESIKSWKAVLKGDGDRTYDAKREAIEFLSGLISDIEHFDLPHLAEKKPSDALSVNVHQHNEQNQTTQISVNLEYIVEILKGELRTSEIEELKEILDSSDEPKVKKRDFIQKIKSFGSDVASNILANLLTNPQVYEQLGGML